eukprot:Nitzschia sp. Nitz4//scaffold63_size106090//21899//28360//NITZ4_004382-RA/size106090-processed-gene-0.139-mRNA-1//-1//CDS//3329555951//4867//frame0
MADLFAGLSVNPAASPDKKQSPTVSISKENGAPVDASVATTATATTATTVATTATATTATTVATATTTATVAPSPPTTPSAAAREAASMTSAPATDKLLGLLGGPPPASPRRVPASPTRTPKSQATPHKSTTPSMPTPVPAPAPSMQQNASKSAATTSTDPVEPPSLPTSPVRSAASSATSPPHSTTKPTLRGIGQVVTPVPHDEVAMRLFRKFAQKTRPHVPSSHGGSKSNSIIGYLFGSPTVYDSKFDAYKSLMQPILEGTYDEADAPLAIARFCHLLNVWGHASAHMAQVESTSSSTFQTFSDILAAGLDTATALVTHGCLDAVKIRDVEHQTKYAVDVLCESIFSLDLSQPRVELAAVKFLLSTGCRVLPSSEAMLHGTHLLQTIRILYHVYLTTDTDANKTTARASLQQLVTSVFVRMIHATDMDSDGDHSDAEFPTEHHRDAFLVLRSLCKLSMRAPPSHLHSHVGLQAGNSNTTWDAQSNALPLSPSSQHVAAQQDTLDGMLDKHNEASLVYTQAIHPALESKLLALDLLLYVLQTTPMTTDFVQHSGRSFHAAVRNYLCVSLLKNCTSDDTRVVQLSLRVFVPLVRNFRSILKTEIEAFVTNVFFVILDSPNSPMEHKLLVVTLFHEICSDPQTLAELFLNYDCDLSAVDLFHRMINTLGKVARSLEMSAAAAAAATLSFSGTTRMENERRAHRNLRLEAMRALKQVLASLYGTIVQPMPLNSTKATSADKKVENGTAATTPVDSEKATAEPESATPPASNESPNLVENYGSKKKRREEESEIMLRFNMKPAAGIAYAAKCGHVDGSDPDDVARFLLANKDKLDKTQIGDYLGREPEYQGGFAVKVLHSYVNTLDFAGMVFDDAIRHYLSGFRLPGEAQKIDRFMERFAERFMAQNPEVFPTADAAFILSFSIIMLNTDLHNPAIKEERRMTKEGFIQNNRGICDGQDLPHDMLREIFDRIKTNPISLKEDDDARERVGETAATTTSLQSALSPAAFFTRPYEDEDRAKESNFIKERDQIVRTTESLLRRRRQTTDGRSHRRSRSNSQTAKHPAVKYVRTEDSGLRDEYVSPMFDVTWGPALAAFSTAMESANGTVGALLAIATDEELEEAAANAAETFEVCLTGFKYAICTAGLCGNNVARDAYMLALVRFSQLGTGTLLEPRHVRCVQTMLELARSDGELLGSSWEHVFKALSEINRFHQLFHLLARNDRAVAQAAARRRARLEERERRLRERQARRAAKENSDSLDDSSNSLGASDGDLSVDDADLFSDSSEVDYDEEDMDSKEIDEANARSIYEGVSESVIEAIYERSSSLSTSAVNEFILQLCRVSRMEISHYGGGVGGENNHVDLTQVQYRQHHSILQEVEGFHHHQPNIYNLQKLVEVTHYNMDSRPRLVFADIWTPVSAHLTSTALHINPAVAMYAVDSFRQLCIQYLQREELGMFEFQRRFLKPLETVMAKGQVHTTKELLLKCVERLILMFGTPSDEPAQRGQLRSGWKPILKILGLAGKDPDLDIAALGFSLLTTQLAPVLDPEGTTSVKTVPAVLLEERFVDFVDALLVYVAGPHEAMSLTSLEHLVSLARFLADEDYALPLIKKRASTAIPEEKEDAPDNCSNAELELWWPILLGISRAVGDDRKAVRSKGLEVLGEIVTSHFCPSTKDEDESEKQRHIQLLQLVFRGILAPVLEFAEPSSGDTKPPQLPEDFDRFMTGSKSSEPASKMQPTWLDTTFDQFMDACVLIYVRSVESFGDDVLVEELFAMLNSCLLSDSGALVVRGLRRLEQFLMSDMDSKFLSDDTWATVGRMIRRSLSVRSLPRAANGQGTVANSDDSESQQNGSVADEEYEESIREFFMEDNILSDRRYIGSNAVYIMGTLLGAERFEQSLGTRWRLFLVSGLGKAIRDYEQASSILSTRESKQKGPDYLETAFYGRRYMNRFLLQLAATNLSADASSEQLANVQALLKEQTQNLATEFLEREAVAQGGDKGARAVMLYERTASAFRDMLIGYRNLPEERLANLDWLDPLLESCMHTENESVRSAIQKFLPPVEEEVVVPPPEGEAPGGAEVDTEEVPPEDAATEAAAEAEEEATTQE